MEQTRTVEVLKALSDETRLGIVRRLANDEVPLASCDIISSCVSRLSLSQPAMSHHFAKLVSAGILRETKQGTQKMYLLDREYLSSVGINVSKL